jgi:glycosyltransferase involved in cell wall biosynthesis
MKLSIAMCTFNGGDFLKQQLNSFLDQTLLPGELVICDDGSTDGSMLVIEEFSALAPFPVLLHINSQNLGSTKNFEKAISLCTGDIIALADQDDVWYSHKLQSIVDVFVRDDEIGMVFSDADIVDVNLKKMGYMLWQKYDFDRSKQKIIAKGNGFDVFIKNQYATGATMAFRSSLTALLLPISSRWVHDGWISLLASAVTKVAVVAEPLIMYRQHDRQQIGATRMSIVQKISSSSVKSSDYYQNLAWHYQDAFDRLNELAMVKDYCQQRKMQAKFNHLIARAKINDLGFTGLPIIADELLSKRYHRYSSGFVSMTKDLVGLGRRLLCW